MLLIEKPFVTIERDDQLNCLIQTWKGFANSDDFRAAINESLEIFKKGNFDKIISNTKDAALVKKEDTNWVAQIVTPEMVQHGLRYMAFVVPTNVFTQLSVDNFKEEAGRTISIRYFNHMDAAREWVAKAD